jgi:hypothetical protein
MGMETEYQTDSVFHASIHMAEQWLTLTRMALTDEGIDREVTDRVLRRLLYGTVSPGWNNSISEVARLRVDAFERVAEEIPAAVRLDRPDRSGT